MIEMELLKGKTDIDTYKLFPFTLKAVYYLNWKSPGYTFFDMPIDLNVYLLRCRFNFEKIF